ncbi:LPXTG-domain-containing protein cell wall anchor domain protein [Streptomyces viridochromogenes]|uniref:LPXTG-domain-containing protein cell wall anchor domain protein n=1 Tax=Streptomyces viridochromogenes TaxID=1938 RepID=A0A0J7Z9Y4_STRVR|nr:LPXTG cell wall anchor domain-containing protein [Streptomyces viridochromogenes]KMS72619.1 LPXTG-domain-containing protein cell wall anchor domain protein [Streptomyces viridochromogenes]KOG26638.1 LPXTG-domain-containing protein cell wall anchor domain protein [Streptomyces viridochromogenes]KOG28746.1 LPXTG-domain-containing protein cell wall anchor domain protein [Streptomyces viridochromogenes]
MRTLTRVGALSAVAAAAVFSAPAAAHATAPGDNGTVKIHDATTGEELRKNEPHVCEFYLDAFGFDSVQKVDWHIEAWAPTAAVKGETVKSGAITLDGEGHGRTADMTLADGHYKLFWNFEGENGSAKHKVFWTDCEDEEPGGGSTASPSASASPSGTPDESTTDPSASPSTSSEGAPAASPSPQGGTEGDLAETGNGAPVGLLSAAAAALLGAGGYLVLRRRKA